MVYPRRKLDMPNCWTNGRPFTRSAFPANNRKIRAANGKRIVRRKLDPRPLSGSCSYAVTAKEMRSPSAMASASNRTALGPVTGVSGMLKNSAQPRLLINMPAKRAARMPETCGMIQCKLFDMVSGCEDVNGVQCNGRHPRVNELGETCGVCRDLAMSGRFLERLQQPGIDFEIAATIADFDVWLRDAMEIAAPRHQEVQALSHL